MADILIRGMEMPKEGTVIAIYKLKGKYYASMHGTELCPLVPVPPHGRLIDADALRLTHCKECTLYPDKCMENAGEECDWNSIYHIDHLAPTIIEAEEEQE